MKKTFVLFLIYIACLVLLASSVQGLLTTDLIKDYGDPLYKIESKNFCYTTNYGITLSSQPCSSANFAGHTVYNINTTQGKIALAFYHPVVLSAQRVIEKTRWKRIRGISGVRNVSVQLRTRSDDVANTVQSVLENFDGTCDLGAGSFKRELAYSYRNGSSENFVVCYDNYKGGKFSYVTDTYEHSLINESYKTLEPIGYIVNTDFSFKNLYLYEFNSSKIRVSVNWSLLKNPFNNHIRTEFYVISYLDNLTKEINNGQAVILDPFFFVELDKPCHN